MGMVDDLRGWIGGFGVEQWMAVASAVIAFASFLFNWRLVSRQERREAANLKLAHDSDIIRWSDEVIAVLADANEMLCEKGESYPDAEFRIHRSATRARVSALIDRGRLFFPNLKSKVGHGADKEAGYQGHRQPVLDALVGAYDLLDKAASQPGPDLESAAALRVMRRQFVAEVFKAVDPERRGVTLKELSQ